MQDKIVKYYIEEKKTTPVVAKVLSKKLLKYDDIASEFVYWLENREYKEAGALSLEGYTAKKLSDMAPLDAAGVYAFMVSLRDDKENALETIKKGFPRK